MPTGSKKAPLGEGDAGGRHREGDMGGRRGRETRGGDIGSEMGEGDGVTSKYGVQK